MRNYTLKVVILYFRSEKLGELTFEFDKTLLNDYIGTLKPNELALDDLTIENVQHRSVSWFAFSHWFIKYNTVKPVRRGHLCIPEKVSPNDRCPLTWGRCDTILRIRPMITGCPLIRVSLEGRFYCICIVRWSIIKYYLKLNILFILQEQNDNIFPSVWICCIRIDENATH